MEQPELEEDINLLHYHQEVEPTASLDPEVEQVPCNHGDTEILGDNPKEQMHNISFDESHHRVVQSCRVFSLDDNTSPTDFEERVIISDMHKHLLALDDATRAYAKATSSSFCFLIAENERMDKELYMAK